MTPKQQRKIFLIVGMLMLFGSAALILNAFNQHIIFFYTPSDLTANIAPGRTIRIGGLVREGSLKTTGENQITFTVTDLSKDVQVRYTGIVPSLFREGQGVVAEGKMTAGEFQAVTILAKHDENYMPPEVAEALKKSGHWKDNYRKSTP